MKLQIKCVFVTFCNMLCHSNANLFSFKPAPPDREKIHLWVADKSSKHSHLSWSTLESFHGQKILQYQLQIKLNLLSWLFLIFKEKLIHLCHNFQVPRIDYIIYWRKRAFFKNWNICITFYKQNYTGIFTRLRISWANKIQEIKVKNKKWFTHERVNHSW